MAASLKRAAITGAIWSALSTFFSRGFRFFITILLARVLVPQDFGLIAMSMVVMDIAEMLRDLGLGAALIQRKHLEPQHLNTCFWANVAIGITLWVLTLAMSPLVVHFYRNAAVGPILRLMSVNFLISPFGSIPWVLLNRQLRFRELMIAQTLATAVRGVTSLVLAWMGFGVWSLAWGPIAGNLAGAVINEWFCRWHPTWTWSKRHFMDLFHFGKNVFGERILGYFSANSDYLITGRVLGAEMLGYYNFAYQIPHLAETHLAPVVGRVLFPVLSQVQDDRERLCRGYLHSLRWIAVVCAPFSAGLCVVAPEFIPTVYGARWAPVIVPLQMLCLAGFAHAITNTVWTVQQAVGRSDIGFIWNAVMLPFVIGALVFSSRWGMFGIATTMMIASTVLALAVQQITNRLIGLSWRRWISAMQGAVLATAGMTLATESARLFFLSLEWSKPAVLIAETAVGLVAFTILLFLLERPFFAELTGLLHRGSGPESEAPVVIPQPEEKVDPT